MKNKIYYISSKKMQYLKTEFNKKKDVFIVEIDGNLIQDEGEFLDVMTEKFKFPYHVNGFDGYLDWIRDLEWLGKEEYILIISNFSNFIKRNDSLKKIIIEDIEDLHYEFKEDKTEKDIEKEKEYADGSGVFGELDVKNNEEGIDF